MESFEPNLNNLIEQKSLQWIFVGGKGGVGKTTTSASIALRLAKHRENVLIISTDPAHNLSDAFDQKFSDKPQLVKGLSNLYCMEIDPANYVDKKTLEGLFGIQGAESGMDVISEIMNSVPGIDEAMNFAEVMKIVIDMKFETIIFDTAPTGHTLRLLNFPHILQKAMDKLLTLKQKFGGIFTQFSTMFGGGGGSNEDSQKQVFDKMENLKKYIDILIHQFKDSKKTTFVGVCIPEFLSVYETERLVVELAKFDIDIRNIVINQVLVPETEHPCKMCTSRSKMQSKYITQLYELYDDFHLVKSPLQEEEVRGVEKLTKFGDNLFQ